MVRAWRCTRTRTSRGSRSRELDDHGERRERDRWGVLPLRERRRDPQLDDRGQHDRGHAGGIQVATADMTVTASLLGSNTDVGGSGAATTDIGTRAAVGKPVSKHNEGGVEGKDNGATGDASMVRKSAGSVTITANVIKGIVDPNLTITDGGGNGHLDATPGLGALGEQRWPDQDPRAAPGQPGARSPARHRGTQLPRQRVRPARSRLRSGSSTVGLDIGAYEAQAIAIVPRFTG